MTTPDRKPAPTDPIALYRALNYLSLAIVTLRSNALLHAPLEQNHVKPQIDGHWGSCTGINAIYAAICSATIGTRLPIQLVIGTGHAGPSFLAAAYLEGLLSDLDDRFGHTSEAIDVLCSAFNRDLPTEISALYPGATYSGGELGYGLTVAQGVTATSPGDLVAVVVGDGELETGTALASLLYHRAMAHSADGMLLPIINANSLRMTDRSVLSHLPIEELCQLLRSVGHDPLPCGPDVPSLVLAITRAIGSLAASEDTSPVVIYRNVKGHIGPSSLAGQPFAGTPRSHKIKQFSPATSLDHLRELEEWLRLYRPDELFTSGGSPRDVLRRCLPGDPAHQPLRRTWSASQRRSSSWVRTPVAPLGPTPADAAAASLATAGDAVFVSCPDEAISNRLAHLPTNGAPSQQSRFFGSARCSRSYLSVLNEPLCAAWLLGVIRGGHAGVYASYEGFSGLTLSLLEQHATFISHCLTRSSRKPWPSLTVLLTSLGWHNVPSHHSTASADYFLFAEQESVDVLFPFDNESTAHVITTSLAAQDCIRIITYDKYLTPTPAHSDITRHETHAVQQWQSAGHSSFAPSLTVLTIGDVMYDLAASSLLPFLARDSTSHLIPIVDPRRFFSQLRVPTTCKDTSGARDIIQHSDLVVVLYNGLQAVPTAMAADIPCLDGKLLVRGFRGVRTPTGGPARLAANGLDPTLLRDDIADRLRSTRD